jgi:hypothetical protein
MRLRKKLAERAEELLDAIEEKLKFLSLLGTDFVIRESPLVALEETILQKAFYWKGRAALDQDYTSHAFQER